MSVKALLRSAVILAAVLLLGVATSADRVVQAQSHSQGAILTGTWFVSVPNGLTAIYSFHHGGTISGAISTMFGGPPLPIAGPVLHSSDNGIWRQTGHRFEAVIWRFSYDTLSGEAKSIVRIRLVGSLDRGRSTGSGEFFVTTWSCPDQGLGCPDPSLVDPTMPEFAPPGNTFTMTRSRPQ